MPQIDNYRSRLNNARKKLADLRKELAHEQEISAQQQKKISNAQSALSRTNTQSVIKSKYSEIERASKALASSQDKIGKIQTKIASVEKEIANVEKSLSNEETRIAKKNEELEKKFLKESKKRADEMEKNLARQKRLQDQLKRDVDILKSIPKNITVLFLASNPINTQQLRLDEEVHSIQEKIRLSDYRDSIKFESRWAVRPSDILQTINELNPTIIHFSGHGTINGDLVLQNPDGSTKIVTKKAMTATISTLSNTIRLVVFNACFSESQAIEAVEHIEAAIGMSDAIGDEAARIFASQLYSSIGFGHSLKKSFKQAKAALLLEGISEENTPQLFVHENINSDEIILVQPDNPN